MNNIKRIIFIFISIFLFAEAGYGIGLNVFGNLNRFMKSGDAADYILHENEFPIAAAHFSNGFGFAVTGNINRYFFCGFETVYNLKSSVLVTDPSDNDTAKIDTYKNIMGYFTIGVRIIERHRMSFFFQGGGGGYLILGAESAEYTTSRNYILRIEPPEKKYGFAGFAGLGVEYKFWRNMAAIFSARYLYIAAEYPQMAIVSQIGLRFLF